MVDTLRNKPLRVLCIAVSVLVLAIDSIVISAHVLTVEHYRTIPSKDCSVYIDLIISKGAFPFISMIVLLTSLSLWLLHLLTAKNSFPPTKGGSYSGSSQKSVLTVLSNLTLLFRIDISLLASP